MKIELLNWYRTICVDGRSNALKLIAEAKRKGWFIEAIGENSCYCIVRVPKGIVHVLERQSK